MLSFLDTLVQGVLLGGLYALFALGQSLLFGVMRLTNTAHGDFIILSAFVAWSLAVVGGSPWWALIVLLRLAFAGGYLLQRLVLNGTIGRDPMRSLVVTFGLAIVIQNVLKQIYPAAPRSIDWGGLNTATFQLAEGFSIGALPLLIFPAALALTARLQLRFDRAHLGRSV